MADAIFSGTEADAILNALTGQGTYTAPAGVYVQCHTAAPGSAGTTAVASLSTRKQALFATPSSGGAGTVSNTTAVQWTTGFANETITDVSLWSTVTANTRFLGSIQLTTPKTTTTSTDTLTIGIGALTFSLTHAS